MDNNQTQKAGDNSQQVQIINPTFNGITEKRAREIFTEMNEIACKNYTHDAFEIAITRVNMFEELLMKKVQEVNGMLEAFKDPSFQFLLTEAQKRAAASDRKADLEMLTELLAHRVEKKDDRKIKASISKAIEIVDQIDDDALCGLTLAVAINRWLPTSGDISHGLAVMDNLFSSLCYRKLPSGFDWVSHLDILNAVRSTRISTLKTFKEYYTDVLIGYTCVGIQKDSKNYSNAVEILEKANLSPRMLVPHELNEGFMRLNVRDKDSIMNQMVDDRKVTTQEVEALNQIWNLYSTDTSFKRNVNIEFMKKWDTYDSLKSVRLWWESLPHDITITPIGVVLAHANAQKHYYDIPSLNI